MIGLVQPQSRVLYDGSNINLVSNATAGAWTAWTQIVASSNEFDGVILQVSWCGSSSCYNLFEIGIGGAGAEVPVVEGVLHHYQQHGGSRGQQQSYFWPIRIPAGSRISIRRRCDLASKEGYVRLGRIRNGRPVGVGVESYGVVTGSPFGTAVTSSGTAGAYGSRVTLGVTSRRIRQISLSVAGSAASGWVDWELSLGASGSEVPILAPDATCTTMGDSLVSPILFGPFDQDIPAGTRISVRHAYQYSSAQLYYAAQGVY